MLTKMGLVCCWIYVVPAGCGLQSVIECLGLLDLDSLELIGCVGVTL